MSDELERRLREAGHRLPEAGAPETAAARARFLDAVRSPRRRLPRRGAAFAFAAAIVVAGAFGVGYAVAAGRTTTKTVTRTKVVKVTEKLNAGPGFLPDADWYTATSGTAPSLEVTAANAPLTASTSTTTFGANRVVLRARFSPASTQPSLPTALLPLRLDDATPAGGASRELSVRVAGYAVDVSIVFGSAQPSDAVLVAAREELGRLVVPSCPAAQPLAAADVEAAKRHVLAWLPAHYPGDAADVVGATATAALGGGAPRRTEAAADCGPLVANRTVEVDVTLPVVAKVSASLSELTYFVAKTPDGWTVWERAR